jgi:serine/threonine protein kinase
LKDTRIVIFTEHIKGGTLSDFVKENGDRLTESEARKVFKMLISAVNYCHKNQVTHRDIKMDNILLNDKQDLEKGIKLIDFGIAGAT